MCGPRDRRVRTEQLIRLLTITFHISERNRTMIRSMSRRRGRKHYGFIHLLFDFVLTILTGGLWLLWIFIRFLRSNT